jgi:hypothetical protein
MAFSRILNDQEVVVIANTSTSQGFQGEVIVDRDLNPAGSQLRILYSNKTSPNPPSTVREKAAGSVSIAEIDGSTTQGPARALSVRLQSLEIQILGH